MEKSNARQTLDRARILLRFSDDLNESDRDASVALLEAAIVFGRSVTLHLQTEMRHRPGFDDWYAEHRSTLEQDQLCRFFLNTRNFIVHQGPSNVSRNISVSIGLAVEVSEAFHVQVIRGGVWYKRRPKILWEDFRRAFTEKVRGHKPRLERLILAIDNLSTGWLPKAENSVSEGLEDAQQKVAYTWHFADENWQDRSASDLVSHYLDTLEPLIRDAEREFLSKD